jgi:Fic-DOC domain mobile mystery protein B
MNDPLVPVARGTPRSATRIARAWFPPTSRRGGELFAAEEANVATATFGLRPSPSELLDDLYLRRLHQAMFDRVWR